MNRGFVERVARREIALAAGLIVLVAAVLVGRWLFDSHTPYAGTNTVAPKFGLPGLARGQTLCIKGITLPAAANGFRVQAAAGPAKAHVTLRLAAGGAVQVSRATAPAGALGPLDFRIAPPGHEVPARACLTTDRTLTTFSGQPGASPAAGVGYIDGKPMGVPSVWYLREPPRRVVSALPDAASRASLFRAGFVGPWTYVALAVLLPLAWFAGLRLVRRGER